MEKSLSLSGVFEQSDADLSTRVQNLNSTALDCTYDTKDNIASRDLAISPIPRSRDSEETEQQGTDDYKQAEDADSIERCETPPAPSDTNTFDATEPSTSEETKSSVVEKENQRPETSTPEKTVKKKHRVKNPFEEHLLRNLHSNTFSPSVFKNIPDSPQTPLQHNSSDFKWSIEHLAILKPANITDEEIANSAHSPDPELEAKCAAALDVYWKSGLLCIPSPEFAPPRDAMKSVPQTPLGELVRLHNAVCAEVTRPSPLRRPSINRVNGKTKKRHCGQQTALTIPPTMHFDFAAVLGSACVYEDNNVEAGEEFEANVSVNSVNSLRRRLFASESDNVNNSFLTDDTSAQPSANCTQNISCDDSTAEEPCLDLEVDMDDALLANMRADLGGETPVAREMPDLDAFLSPIKADEDFAASALVSPSFIAKL